MLKYSINLIFLYAFPSAAPEFLKESGSLLIRSMNEIAWKWNTSFGLWLVFIAKMVIYSYFWTAASFFVHITSVLSRELFLCTNSSDTVCEMVLVWFFFSCLEGKIDCLVANFWFSILGEREEERKGALRGTAWGRGRRAPGACCRREGGREARPALLVLAHPSYIKYYMSYIL